MAGVGPLPVLVEPRETVKVVTLVVGGKLAGLFEFTVKPVHRRQTQTIAHALHDTAPANTGGPRMPTDPITDAINRVGQDVRDLRVDLTGRLDAMVPRREHDAEVKRIDAEARATRQALSTHELTADERHKRLTATLDAQAAQRTADRRFVATWVVAAVGVAATVTGVLNAVFGG